MDGILLINKEVGMTSFDVVAKLRKILHIKRIGHSGTLDPNATGVLMVFIGKACKCLPYIQDKDKAYIATICLGKQTISDDIWGEVIREAPIKAIDDFQGLLDQFKGKIKQLPPYISSIKINGKKLYEYARNHEFIERPIRNVEIYDIKAMDNAKLKFYTHCSSGTYIRSICRDLALLSGNVGCMASLERVKVGRFSLDDCVSLLDVENGNYHLIDIKEVLDHYQMIEYDNRKDIECGKIIKLDVEVDEVVITCNHSVMAIYKRIQNNEFRCERGLW